MEEKKVTKKAAKQESSEEADTPVVEKKPTKQETLSIMCYGQDTKPRRELVQEAIDFAQEKETDLVKIYQVHRWGDMWDECQQKKPRPINSVILDSNITETVI